MARIRTIKPEFWDSPSLPADPWARLTFIALWNWADDYGVGTFNERELLGFIFPNDEWVDSCKLHEWLMSVETAFDLVFFKVGRRAYYYIPSWDSHQTVNRPSKKRNPSVDDADEFFTLARDSGEVAKNREALTEGSCKTHESLTEPSCKVYGGTGTGTGTGSGTGTTSSSAAASDGSPYTDDFLEWWKHYPRKQDKGGAFKAWKKIKHATLEELIAGADRYANDPNRTDQYTKHAATWLNNRSWEDEDGQPARETRSFRPSNEQRMTAGQNAVRQAQFGKPDLRILEM